MSIELSRNDHFFITHQSSHSIIISLKPDNLEGAGNRMSHTVKENGLHIKSLNCWVLAMIFT